MCVFRVCVCTRKRERQSFNTCKRIRQRPLRSGSLSSSGMLELDFSTSLTSTECKLIIAILIMSAADPYKVAISTRNTYGPWYILTATLSKKKFSRRNWQNNETRLRRTKETYLTNRIHSLSLGFRFFFTVSKFNVCQETLSSFEGFHISVPQYPQQQYIYASKETIKEEDSNNTS